MRERLNRAGKSGLPRRVGLVVAWAVVGLLGTLLVTFAGSLAVGHKLVVVGSDSQSPSLRDGDVAVERQVHPGEVETDQIITFSEPGTGHQVSHRVVALKSLPGKTQIVTKGDSKDSYERFTVPDDGEVGVVMRRVPWVGFIADVIGGPLALLLLALAVIGLAAWLGVNRRRLRAAT